MFMIISSQADIGFQEVLQIPDKKEQRKGTGKQRLPGTEPIKCVRDLLALIHWLSDYLCLCSV